MASREVPPLVGTIIAALEPHADPERAAGARAYLKSSMPMLGVPMPQLRRVVRPLLRDPAYRLTDRDQWETTVRALWDRAAVREHRYAALEVAVAGRHRTWRDAPALPLVEHLVRTGAWWDLVDPVATGLLWPILARGGTDGRAAATRMRSWAGDDDLWLRRVAIIGQLPAGEATDVGLLAEVIDANLVGSRHGDTFWVRKAIGWALRQYARTDPDWVREVVAQRSERLSGLSRREALKHLS